MSAETYFREDIGRLANEIDAKVALYEEVAKAFKERPPMGELSQGVAKELKSLSVSLRDILVEYDALKGMEK